MSNVARQLPSERTSTSDGTRRQQISLYDLVSAQQDRSRNVQTQSLGGFQIDRQLEFCRVLDWKTGWLFAFQDSIHIHGCAIEKLDDIRPIGHEPALSRGRAVSIDRRHPIAGRRGDEPGPVRADKDVGRSNDRCVRDRRQSVDFAFHIVGRVSHPGGIKRERHSRSRRRQLSNPSWKTGRISIGNEEHALRLWGYGFQKVQHFCYD